jgi:hypothetical protein
LILFLCSCKFKDVSDSIYIASVAVEKVEDEYKGYFYLPSSVEVGNSNPDNESKKGEIGISTGKSITDIFYNIEFSISLSINYAHIATMVFHESILNNDDIDKLLQFFKNSHNFDFNFYIFITKENVENIYTFTNPNKESVINTLLVEPHNLEEQFLSANAIHYLTFSNYFYTKRCIPVPLIEIDYSWKIDDKDIEAYSARGLCYYHNGEYEMYEYMDQKLEYLKSNELLYYSDNKISLTLRNYKVKYKYKDNLEIIITGIIDRVVINEDVDVTKYMTDVVTKYIIDILDEVKQDFLNLEYYSSIYKKDYTLDAIVLNIKIKTVD